jgi:hypothetical protein
MSGLTVVSFGGGTDSTAMLIGMVERAEPPPHAILFGDTGGEFPHTYEHIRTFSDWLVTHNYPAVHSLRRNKKDGSWESLEDECLRIRSLPSIAYGYKTCSQKFKIEPQDKWCNNDPGLRAEWKVGRKVRKLIGYDWDEFYRAKFYDDKKYTYEYPLIDWRWRRKDCVEAIARAGLKQPRKSSCFFCPHMRPDEIRTMRDQYPDLLDRALAMEAGAKLTSIAGLGRDWSWRAFLQQGDLPLMDTKTDRSAIDCNCFEAGETL